MRSLCLAVVAACALPVATATAAPIIEMGTQTLLPNTPGQTFYIYGYGGTTTIQGVFLEIQTGDGGYYSFGSGTATNPYSAPPITSTGVANTPPAVNLAPTHTSIFTVDDPSTNFTGNSSPPPATFNAPPSYGGASTHIPGSGSPGLPSPTPYTSQFWELGIGVKSGTVTFGGATQAQHQLLATVTIDTTGFFSGSFPIKLVNTHDTSSNYSDSTSIGGPIDFTSANAPDGLIVIAPEPSSAALLLFGAAGLLLKRRKKIAGL